MNATTSIQISDRRRIGEIAVVLATGAGKFIFMDWLNFKFPFILVSIIAWGAYIWLRAKSTRSVMKYWGFRTDNFRQAWNLVLPFGALAVLSFLVVGYFQDTLNPTWHIIPILITYPIWGVIQQFLVIALIAGNLQDLEATSIKEPITILLTAIVFGAIHYPYNWLIAGTFILAIFYGYVYLKVRNVWVLGLIHGWLGGLFFYTVVNRDPFLEVFGKYLN